MNFARIQRSPPYPGNSHINDAAVKAVANSLREFGFRQPIVADADGVNIVGHTRLKAAQKLGLTHLSVHVATDLCVEQVRTYRLTDNQSATLSSWEFELIPIEITALKNANYDLDCLGFDSDEMTRILNPEAADELTEDASAEHF